MSRKHDAVILAYFPETIVSLIDNLDIKYIDISKQGIRDRNATIISGLTLNMVEFLLNKTSEERNSSSLNSFNKLISFVSFTVLVLSAWKKNI